MRTCFRGKLALELDAEDWRCGRKGFIQPRRRHSYAGYLRGRGKGPDQHLERMGCRERVMGYQEHVFAQSNSTAPRQKAVNMFCG